MLAQLPNDRSFDSQVQGVFFRKYTVAEAQRLELVGYVRNTERGTVEGKVQGQQEKLASFKVCTLRSQLVCDHLSVEGPTELTHTVNWFFRRSF